MKKRYLVIPAAMALLAAVCLSESRLPEEFDRNRVYRTAKGFINRLNKRDYEVCYNRFNRSMRSTMDLEKLRSRMDSVLDSLGGFVRFKGVSAVSKKVLGEDYAVCTVKCIYKNGPATFTISIDKNLRIGGLYIK